MDSNVTYDHVVETRPEAMHFSNEAHSSGVSWGAVIGGAFAASAFYLILLALGAGMGLSAISPWSNSGLSATALGVSALVWLTGIEIIASALGGYLTGRLRTKWTLIHSDEVYFRDTANGFLAWAVALMISVTLLVSAGATMVGGVSQGIASSNTPVAGADLNAYFVDRLFRSDRPVAEDRDLSAQAEADRILANGLRQDQMPAADQAYLVRLVTARTGISQQEAERRVSDVVAEARQAEDAARKVMARLLFWSFIALLLGAFSASFAATIGGRQRDHMPAV